VVSNIKSRPDEKRSSADFEYYVLGLKSSEHDTVIEVEKLRNLVTHSEGVVPRFG